MDTLSLPRPLHSAPTTAPYGPRWIADHDDDPGGLGWTRAVYFMVDLAAHEAHGEPAYLDYVVRSAETNTWAISNAPTGQPVTCDATADFGVGSVLTARSQVHPRPRPRLRLTRDARLH